MAKLIMPKNSALIEEIEAVLKIYYEAGDWLSNDDYKSKLKAIIGDDQYPSSYTKKAQIPSYFGFTEWYDITSTRAERRITTSGKRMYEAIKKKDTAAMLKEIVYSLEHTTFGRNNFGCPDSDSDIEAPAVFVRASLDLGYLTYKEFAYLLWKLEDLGGNYTDEIKELRKLRTTASFDIDTEATKYTDAKPIMIMTRWGFFVEDNDGGMTKKIRVNPSVLEKYKERLEQLPIYNVDKVGKNSMVVISPTADIFEIIKAKYEKHDYEHIESEKLREIYRTFASLYGRDALSALSGSTLLYRVFGTKGQDELSLTYSIERKYTAFGSCRGAYGWANVLTCYQGKQWQYCTSATDIKNISEAEAIEKAKQLTDNLLLAIELIDDAIKSDKLTSQEGYESLDTELKTILGDLYNKPRFKKYFAMLYPDLFMNMYDYILKPNGWLNRIFTTLRLGLDGNWYTQSGRFTILARQLGIPNLDLYLVVKQYLEESGEVAAETENGDDNAIFDEDESEDVEIIEEKKTMIKREPRIHRTHELNTILYGAPGTGKTYSTAEYALAIIENRQVDATQKNTIQRAAVMQSYKEMVDAGRIVFTTFHQSYGYEDFVQGLRPVTNSDKMTFKPIDGVFKEISDRAMGDTVNDYVLIIDEINRANISKVFGELITLIEDDKRWGEINQLSVILPSGQRFAVPNNLYIVGTMNSADKSISLIDTALRRRFVFIEQEPQAELVADATLKTVLERVNELLRKELDSTDLLIGHSYFMGKTKNDLCNIMNRNIIPLLYEYFFDNSKKVKTILQKAVEGFDFEVSESTSSRLKIAKKG